MEAAIQTVVKVFLKSTKGKESLGQKDFQSLVKSQLGNILSVRKSSLNLSLLPILGRSLHVQILNIMWCYIQYLNRKSDLI